MKKINRSFLLLIISAIPFLLLACQPAPRVESRGDYILQITQIDTSQFPGVDVYISVKDTSGEPQIINTNKLQLLENGQPVDPDKITSMGEVGTLSTLLLIDNSGSMNYANKLETAKTAAKQFLSQMRPGDKSGIITFNTEVDYIQELTEDQTALEKAVDSITASSDTAMYDAMQKAIDILNPLPGRKAVIVLTDGMDNESQSSPEEVLGSIGFGGLSISTVGFGEPPLADEEVDVYAGIDEPTLRSIANQAGGIYGYADDQTTLSSLYDRIRRSLQSEVVISYITPLTLRDGVQRALTVALTDQFIGEGGRSLTRFNPGGLVPEVAQPASWLKFGVILVVLIALLAIPLVIQIIRGGKSLKRKKKIRITLKD